MGLSGSFYENSVFFVLSVVRDLIMSPSNAAVASSASYPGKKSTKRSETGHSPRADSQTRQLPHISAQFRHPFIGNGYDIRSVQELLGHRDVSTTMMYTHVMNKPGLSIRSPLDAGKQPKERGRPS